MNIQAIHNNQSSALQVSPAELEANKQLLKRHFDEVVNQKQLNVIPQIFADNFHSISPKGDIVNGRDNLSQYLSHFFTAFPDLHIAVEEIIAENDKVVARVTVTGTQQGEFWGIPASNKPINIQEIFIVKVASNQVVEARPVADLHLLLQQLQA